MTEELRSGITTGTCAAAAAKAAVLALTNQQAEIVTITNPQGQKITVPVQRLEFAKDNITQIPVATAAVIKDGGDDPDVTHGLEVLAHVQLQPGQTITLIGGRGIGKVTKPGLQVEVGDWAINPVPRAMITQAVQEALPADCGALVTIEVPGGEGVAHKTLNPKLGIVGGISILGTTGIVRPMSQDAFQDSLIPQLGIAKAYNFDTVILTPGHMGEKFATDKYQLPAEAVVQMSNFVGFMLEACVKAGIKRVILWGHHGKLVKVAGGSFNTHSKISDGRREVLAAYSAALGADAALVERILSSNTAEEAAYILAEGELLDPVFARAAETVCNKAESYVQHQLEVGTVLLSLKGEILASSDSAKRIGRELGWNL